MQTFPQYMTRTAMLLVVLRVTACGSGRASPLADEPVADAGGSGATDALDAPNDALELGPDVVAEAVTDAPAAASHDVLFIGNSFTFVNDLDKLYASLFDSEHPGALADIRRVAPGGWRLDQHLADSAGAGELNGYLVTGAAGPPAWSFVVLQEQSQIPGFTPGNAEYDSSQSAAVALAALAHARGATSVLFQTWGYRDGDSTNAQLFPDYPTMQSALDAGYAAMRAGIEKAGHPVRLARVGDAFHAVYDEDAADGGAPTAPGSLFSSLYQGDTRHPALPGSYLAACVMRATLESPDVLTAAWVPSGLDAAVAAHLRAIAVSIATP